METKDLLNPKIGIDRSVLYNFTLEGIDTELLAQRASEKDMLDSPCDKITFLENRSSIVIAPGSNIGKLCIEDRQYGRFEVSYRKNNFTGQQYVFSQIQMRNWNEQTGNVRSLTATEYKQSVRDMIEHFKKVYGVKINASDIRIKEIEFNATFFLEEAFESYAPAITLMMINLPESRYKDRKFVTWQQVREGRVCLETTVAKNSTSQIKIYNKSKHLEDIGIPLHTEKDIFRLEYTIRDSRILEHTDNMNSPGKFHKSLLMTCLVHISKEILFLPIKNGEKGIRKS